MVSKIINLVYIDCRKLFAKNDWLTISALITSYIFFLWLIYKNYEHYYWVLFLFLVTTMQYHLGRKDISFLKMHVNLKKILFWSYFIENSPILILFLYKKDYFFVILYLIFLVIIPFLPQKTQKIRYPFELSDPFWHISFRKNKLVYVLPLPLLLCIIGKVYDNINLSIFSLGLVGFLSTFPYFEREYLAHLSVSAHRGEKYLWWQIKSGFYNALWLFLPTFMVFLYCFSFENSWILPLFFGFPLLGILSKYAFFENSLLQGIVFSVSLAGIFQGLPLLILPFLVHLSVKNIKKMQYVVH